MGLFKRIWNWICSLFGGKQKDEMSEITGYVRQMQEALRNMKSQTEAVMAAQEKRKREISTLEGDIAKMEKYAARAEAEGDTKNVLFFKERVATLQAQKQKLEIQSENAMNYTRRAEELYRQAEVQMADITARKDEIKAKMAAAELTMSISELQNGATGRSLKQQHVQAQTAMDKAEAMAELDDRRTNGELQDLMKKYDQAETQENQVQENQVQESQVQESDGVQVSQGLM